VDDGSKPFFVQALDRLKAGDRRGAAFLLGRELREGNTSAKNLPSVSQLAAHIGEIDLAAEAARRGVVPGSTESLLAYWAVLATYGRSGDALADLERQPASIRNNPFVLHFRAAVANERGHFDEAQALFRQALATAPSLMQTWFPLAMLKKFTPGDPDIISMERLERQDAAAPAEDRARLYYALGKAWEDCGDVDRAFEYYEKGAALRRQQRPFDATGLRQAADRTIRDFTPENVAKLIPSRFEGQRSVFVTGLPRSGTTLTEQMLVGHSAVADAAELNLFGAALIPARGSFEGALAYQQASGLSDPWGEIARDYAQLVDAHFRSSKLVVDKSLGQSLLIGLMLHAMPDARIAWLRRAPDDVALSCFKTYFTTGLPWTWSLTDIADVMRVEDRMFEHWRSLFPDRILTVPYEELVASPAEWSRRLQQHFGLPIETGVEAAPRTDRAIRTASITQVHEPISTARIGAAAAFERHLQPFRDRYYA
jgi:tetratricopeptide (TPR) repeat protein